MMSIRLQELSRDDASFQALWAIYLEYRNESTIALYDRHAVTTKECFDLDTKQKYK